MHLNIKKRFAVARGYSYNTPLAYFLGEKMKLAREKRKFFIMELEDPHFSTMPDWRKRALVDTYPSDGCLRRVFFPLFGRKECQVAMQEGAKIVSFRYKPYVDIDWYISYLKIDQDEEMVEILLNLKHYLNAQAEIEGSKHI
jgi:hypothetical protein